MYPYRLQKWAYARRIAGDTILFDTKEDRYLALDQSDTDHLSSILSRPPPYNSGATTLLGELVRRNLIVRSNQSHQCEADPLALQGDAASMGETFETNDFQLRPLITLGHIACFLKSSIIVWGELRLANLHYALSRLKARKALGKVDLVETQVEVARELARIFVLLRTMIYRSHNNSLFDSFVLAHFLATYGVKADCVFGVKTRPFLAHCWIEVNNKAVLQAPPGYYLTFTRILVA